VKNLSFSFDLVEHSPQRRVFGKTKYPPELPGRIGRTATGLLSEKRGWDAQMRSRWQFHAVSSFNMFMSFDEYNI